VIKVIAVPLALAGALGALGGWLWWRWWAPAPQGKVYETPDGPIWFPTPFDPGIAQDFSGTATYVVLGLVLGLVLGVVAAVVARNRAVVGLVAVGLASILAAVVMLLVGVSQSPPDPQQSADQVDIGTELPGHLHVTSPEIGLWDWVADLAGDDDRRLELPTTYLIWPVGGLLGYLAVMLSLNARSEQAEPPSA
jgi:hypothetical protein